MKTYGDVQRVCPPYWIPPKPPNKISGYGPGRDQL